MTTRDPAPEPASQDFLGSGGEMGALIRAHPWETTPLGSPDRWPAPLRTAIRLILNSGHPMYVWWGPDLCCFYNDAYRRSIGPERHPQSLGQPGRQVWDEIWEIVGPQIAQVMSGGGATWHENHLVPITRNGIKEDVYWTYSYSPIDDQNAPNGVGGVLVVCSETTHEVLAKRELEAQADRLNRMFYQAPGFMALLAGPEHTFQATNAAYLQLVGHRDVTGQPVREALPELQGQGFFELLDQVYRSGEAYVGAGVVAELQPRPGELAKRRYLDFVYQPVTGANGEVSGIFVEGSDVTDRHNAEAALRETEERLEAITNSIDQMIWSTRADGFHDYYNERWYEFTGVPRGSTDGEGWNDMFHPQDRERAWERWRHSLKTGEVYHIEYRLRHHSGQYRWVLGRAQCVRDASGAIARWFGTCTDIQEIIEAREVLARTREELEHEVIERTRERNRVWEMSRDLFAIMGFDGHLKAINPAWESTLGRDVETLLGLSFREQIHPDDHAAVEKTMETLLRGESVERFEDRLRHADGSWRWISWTLVPEGDVFYAVGRDVTADKARDAALRLYENIVQSDRSPICAFDTEYRLIAFNDSHNVEFRRENGFETKVGDVLPDMLIPEQRAVMRAFMDRALSGERFTVVEAFGRAEFGQPHWEITYTPLRDEAGRIIGAFHHAKDITDRLLAEAELAQAHDQLRQAQKMEAMGQLTGGVAHDFNNLLTPIVGSLDRLQRKGIGDERERRLIDGALQSAERAKTLVQRLLAFARRQPLQTQAVDVGALVNGMADLVASTSGPRVRVEIDIADDLPPAAADANQVEMAVLNLAVNARDAMPDGGTLTIAARSIILAVGERHGLQPGLYLCLSIADTGTGMDEATLVRAVEPFFSTKGIGRGTGLGLSMVHGLAGQLGGGLFISSKPGLGTCVELFLPASDEAARQAPQVEAGELEAAAGTVLLVDDELLVRMSTADMLGELGYNVVEAGSAEEALQLVACGQPVDVLVTDHLMPGISGVELAYELRRQRPHLPVLVVSGYADVEGLAPDLARLVKPFRQADLAAKLRDLPGATIG